MSVSRIVAETVSVK